MLRNRFLLTLTLVLGTLSQVHTVESNVDQNSPEVIRAKFIKGVLELTNKERERFGLKPLTYDLRLERAAQWMAEDMAIKGYFDHTDSLGREVKDRVPIFGYNKWRILRENLAGGHESAEEVVDAWMHSPSHRDSILCEKCENIGIGYFDYKKAKLQRYWVQEFGAEQPQSR